MGRAGLTRAFGIIAVALQMLTVGCDPGMIIRQADYLGKSPNRVSGTADTVVVSVRTEHQLIGESWYDPEIRVINNSGSTIVVTDVELLAQGKSYGNDSSRPDGPPLTLAPGSTGTVNVGFRLDTAVKNLFFRRPAELLVHYRSGDERKIARARIVGANLDGSR
jgi:hypothetical protein